MGKLSTIREIYGFKNVWSWIVGYSPTDNYTRTRCEVSWKLTIKTPERRHWPRSGVFIVNFEHISHLPLIFLLLTLSRCMPTGFDHKPIKQKAECLRNAFLNLLCMHTWNILDYRYNKIFQTLDTPVIGDIVGYLIARYLFNLM